MAIYTGRTADGSDIKEVEGMYQNHDRTMWSNNPFCEHCNSPEFKAGCCYNLYEYGDCKGQKPILKDKSLPERNSPCLCASGKKYKKCCMPADTAKEKEQLLYNRMYYSKNL